MNSVNTILIIDDDPGARETLEALLRRENYRLAFACCGKEGLKKAQELTPGVILLDVMMPEMNGYDVCRRLRALPRLAEVPILLLTSLDDHESRLQGIEAGADDFLSKPFDFEELRARIRTILRLNRYRRLHQEREKFEWVVQHAQDGYLTINERDQILYANPHAQNFLGLSNSVVDFSTLAAMDEPRNTFLHAAQKQYGLEPQDAWTAWPEHMREDIPVARYLVRPESETSSAFWLQVEVLDFPDGPEAGKVIRLFDVTSRIEAQRNRWGFHTMLSHKLRTPLVGILGSLEFLTQHGEELSSSERVDFSKMALKSAKRLHNEIEEILQYLHASQQVHMGTECHVAECARIIRDTSREFELSSSLTITCPPEFPDAAFLLSRRAIELVFWEILHNAVKFHPSHLPRISVFIELSDRRRLRIRFQDDGIHLSPDQLSQMWLPYYQAEKFSTGEIQGMGLGLAMVASLLWEVGGTCRASNREDRAGVIVELHLPLLPLDEIS